MWSARLIHLLYRHPVVEDPARGSCLLLFETSRTPGYFPSKNYCVLHWLSHTSRESGIPPTPLSATLVLLAGDFDSQSQEHLCIAWLGLTSGLGLPPKHGDFCQTV